MYQINLMYFTGTGRTEAIARAIAASLSDNIRAIDLSDPNLTAEELPGDSITIAAIPVYAGRIPAPALHGLQKFSGNGGRAITIAVYGNRHYDDALVEMNDTLAASGFTVIASGAFIARHSLVNELAAGRPDNQDHADLERFAAGIAKKLRSGQQTMDSTVPGSRPYKALNPSQTPLSVSGDCTACGLCAERCPAEAIDRSNPRETDLDKCITCMRCATICPHNARSLAKPAYERLSAYLLGNYTARRDNETYF